MAGAQFEIRIDGTPRSYRDRKDYAMEAARLIKSKNPHSMVEVKDLRPGAVWHKGGVDALNWPNVKAQLVRPTKQSRRAVSAPAHI